MGRQRLDHRPIVHRQFGFRAEAVPNALRQQRFDIARVGRRRHGVALRGQPLPDRLQVGGVGAVDGDHQRFPRGDDIGGQPVEEPAVPQRQRREAQPQQTFFAGPAFAVRGQHAAGHPRGAAFVGAVHAHRPAVQRGPARDGQPDDAAADDGQ